MRIMVVGPGAIGSLLAARMHASGLDAVLMDHRPERAQQLARRGIQIQTEDRTETFRVPVFCFSATDPSATQRPPPDAVIVCVKAYDSAGAARDAAGVCGPETLVVSLQNGIGNDAVFLETIARSVLLCATTGCGVTRLADGRIRQAGEGPVSLAPCDGAWTPSKLMLASALGHSGFAVTRDTDHRRLVWSKAILNAAINPVTLLFDLPNGGLLTHAVARDRMRNAAREGMAVARALEIPLLYEEAEAEAEAVCRRTAANISSMLQDRRAGRRTEIESINGAIVRAADAAGVAVPVNRELLSAVRATEPTQ